MGQEAQIAESGKARPAGSDDVHKALKERQSSELVIALCGPLGCGIKNTVPILTSALSAQGYTVEHIGISSLMRNAIETNPSLASLKPQLPDPGADQFTRYDKLQNAGDAIRKFVNTSVLAKLAIEDIRVRRKENQDGMDDAAPAKERTVYIVDQLKHPDEARLLRTVYGSLFYMVGVLSKEKERLTRLEREERIDAPKAHKLISRDKQEDFDHGQKLEKTLQSADYFIRNRSGNTAAISKSLERFVDLIHGKNGITPTKDESGMYAAFSASLESACLSRQVGAAICADNGHTLATGKNDVPAPHGGLYSQDHGEDDHRCIHKGAKCYNDEYKNRLTQEITEILQSKPEIKSAGLALTLAKEISKNTQIDSLIEYSRAIHAEMDAIVSLSRNPSSSTQDTTLFATTYPCHNCARHIVTAGIKRVVYIEPYEKSLAEKLHDDAITSSDEEGKIPFEPFEGVAPRRYQVFFVSNTTRKQDGIALNHTVRELKNTDEEYIDSYLKKEKGVIKILGTALEHAGEIQVISSHE